MENWRDKIKQGDITEASHRARVAPTVYQQSKKLSPEDWTAGMARVNLELKKIVEEREQFIAEEMAV